MKRFLTVISSERFIQLLVIAILQSLTLFNVITSDQGTGLINIISGLLAASVTVRTIDKHAELQSPSDITVVSSNQE